MSACILCGIDGSPDAGRAAAVVARLARDLPSRALLVHVAEDARGVPFGLRLPWIGHARTMRKLLKAIAEECCFPDNTELRLKGGDPATALLVVAEEEDAELVVVSSGGTGYASAALLGGVTSALMRSCPCPVVVVPPRAIPPLDAEGMRSVVCGVEGREGDVRALRLAADLAARLGGDLHAVHAHEARDEFDDSAARRLAFALEEAGVEATAHVEPPPADVALESVARHERAGLTVLGPPARGEPSSVLGGYLGFRLAAEGSTALVVLPAEAQLDIGSGHYELAARPA
jgi:nucleotide-binding universal stress UspA family protein